MKIKFSVFWKELAAMRIFVSEDESRYVLNGIYFAVTKGQILLVATDGRRIAVLKSELSGRVNSQCDFILKKDVLTHLESKISTDLVTIEYDSQSRKISLQAERSYITLTTDAIEGNYPNWREVIPKSIAEKHNRPHLYFNADYLEDYAKVANIYGKDGLHIVFTGGELEPAVARIEGVRNFISVVMPMREADVDGELPSWLRKPETVEAV